MLIPEDPDALRAWRDATLYRLVLRASRAEIDETIARLRAQGYPRVSLRHATLLANLDTAGTTISALARRAGMTRQGASQQLVELQREGYVTVEPSPHDSRAVLARQTAEGRTLLHDALHVVAEIEAGYTDNLGSRRMATLKATLNELLERIDPAGRLGPD